MERVVGGEADPREHLLAVRRDGPRRAARRRLGERRRHRPRLVPRGVERRVERLDRHERLGQPVPDGLEPRDRPAELHAAPARASRARASMRPARARDLVRDRAPARRDRRRPTRPARAASARRPRWCSTARRGSPRRGRCRARALHLDGRGRHDDAPRAADVARRRRPARRPWRRAPCASPTACACAAVERAGRVPRREGGQRRRRVGRGSHSERVDDHVVERGAVARSSRRACVNTMSIASRGSASSISSHPSSSSTSSTSGAAARASAIASRTVSSSSARSAASISPSPPRSSSRRAMMLRCTSAVPP